MNIRELIQSIKQRDVTLLEKAIKASENLDVCCPDTGQPLVHLVIELNFKEAFNLLMEYEQFDWSICYESGKIIDGAISNEQVDKAFVEAFAPSAQARLWAQQFLLPRHQQTVYHVPVGLPLEGWYNINAIKLALQSLMNQHDVLRSRFVSNDNALKIVATEGLGLLLKQLNSPKMILHSIIFIGNISKNHST